MILSLVNAVLFCCKMGPFSNTYNHIITVWRTQVYYFFNTSYSIHLIAIHPLQGFFVVICAVSIKSLETFVPSATWYDTYNFYNVFLIFFYIKCETIQFTLATLGNAFYLFTVLFFSKIAFRIKYDQDYNDKYRKVSKKEKVDVQK